MSTLGRYLASLLFILMYLALSPAARPSQAQSFVELKGASNRFEKADSIYGVYGTFTHNPSALPVQYNAVFVRSGEWYEGYHTYVSLGWLKSEGVTPYYIHPIIFWRDQTGAIGITGFQTSYAFGATIEYGIEFRLTDFLLHFYLDGVERFSMPSYATVSIADFAAAGVFVTAAPHLAPPIDTTFSNLKWIKRRSDGSHVKKLWPWNLADHRKGKYTCVSLAAAQIRCGRYPPLPAP